jgi:hypothetical protein
LQSQSWRSENTQGYFFSSFEDKQKIHDAKKSQNPYPSVRYNGPMNVYEEPILKIPKTTEKISSRL